METRQLTSTLEVRDDGRTIVGLAVPYGTPTTIGTYTETFARGAFPDAVTDPASVKLMAQHAHESLPIGRAVTLTDTPEGLQAELRVSDTTAGRDVLALVRDGVATGLSVGFVPIEDQWAEDRTSVVRKRAALLEVSVVAWPAYDDARIATLRAAHQPEPLHQPRLLIARLRLP